MSSKKLTVAIPTFNREEFLTQVLQSLKNQTEQSFDVILFDNASSYNIQSLISHFPTLEIKLDRNETNLGNQANFAKAMSYPYTTPYVMIFHDDDTINPKYFETALKVLDENSHVNWVGSFINYTSANEKMMIFKEIPDKPEVFFRNKKTLTDDFISNAPIGFSTVVYRREVLAGTKPDAQRFHKWLDRPFMLEACNEKEVAIFTFPFINYRIHASQDSAQSYKENIPEMINLVDYFCSTATSGIKNKIWATTSALRTASVNATSISDFFDILKQFQKRGLFSAKYIRPMGVIWTKWLIFKRVKHYLLSK